MKRFQDLSDREIDFLIETEVMGEQPLTGYYLQKCIFYNGGTQYSYKNNIICGYATRRGYSFLAKNEAGDNVRMYTRECYRYSTDIAAAWALVEKMKRDGYNVILYMRNDGKCAVHFSKDPQVEGQQAWSKYDMSKAICESALKAKGIVE